MYRAFEVYDISVWIILHGLSVPVCDVYYLLADVVLMLVS